VHALLKRLHPAQRRADARVYCPLRHTGVDVEACSTCGLRANGSATCTAELKTQGGSPDPWSLVRRGF